MNKNLNVFEISTIVLLTLVLGVLVGMQKFKLDTLQKKLDTRSSAIEKVATDIQSGYQKKNYDAVSSCFSERLFREYQFLFRCSFPEGKKTKLIRVIVHQYLTEEEANQDIPYSRKTIILATAPDMI